MSVLKSEQKYIIEIKQILSDARKKAYSAVNTVMVEAYWRIGERIVLEEQQGKERAEYGKEIIKKISDELLNDFGKGFSQRTVREFRQFYLVYNDLFENNTVPQKWRTVFAKLS
jgi:hypothetical protein